MAKGILIVDKPTTCGACDLYVFDGDEWICAKTRKIRFSSDDANCPLRAEPGPKVESIEDSCVTASYKRGYNDALRDILGD